MKKYLKDLILWLQKKSLLDITILFEGSHEEFLLKLEKLKGNIKSPKFYLSYFDGNKFAITDKSSLGIIFINDSFPVRGITIHGDIEPTTQNRLLIKLKSKLRIEIYLLAFFVPIIYLMMILSKEPLPWFVYILPLLPIPWFIWIYRIQTDGLLKKIILYFNLKLNKNSL